MHEYLQYISKEYGNKGSLKRTKFILEKLGITDLNFDVIHVSGTNGKGSVCYKIAKGLGQDMNGVALFTSPHTTCFTQRIQIDSVPISLEEAFKSLSLIRNLSQKYDQELCYFDCMCILAFYYFHKSGVKVAVIEVGIGGKNDQTNLVLPILSIITSIAFDHQDRLGNTLDAIAEQKSGIIKKTGPAILGPTALLKPILERIKNQGVKYYAIREQKNREEENTMIARRALSLLQERYALSNKIFLTIKDNPECRFELIDSKYLLDIAHNQIALENVFKAIKLRFGARELHVVVSMCKDKNLEECLSLVQKHSDYIYVFDPPRKKLASKERMMTYLTKAKPFDTVFLALEEASKTKGGLVCCLGSAYFMKEVKEFLNLQRSGQSLDRLDKPSLMCNSL